MRPTTICLVCALCASAAAGPSILFRCHVLSVGAGVGWYDDGVSRTAPELEGSLLEWGAGLRVGPEWVVGVDAAPATVSSLSARHFSWESFFSVPVTVFGIHVARAPSLREHPSAAVLYARARCSFWTPDRYDRGYLLLAAGLGASITWKFVNLEAELKAGLYRGSTSYYPQSVESDVAIGLGIRAAAGGWWELRPFGAH